MDCLKKAMIADDNVVLVVLDGTEMVNKAIQLTEAWPPSAIQVGQALLGSFLLMSITTKDDSQSVDLQWSVDGPYGSVFAQASHKGQGRGTVGRPQAVVADLNTPIGSGILQVRRMIQDKPVTGVIKSEGNICTDILNYLHQSEQRRCALNLWVDLAWDENNKEQPFYAKYALGYLVEILPSQNRDLDSSLEYEWEDRIDKLQSLSHWKIDEKNPTDGMLRFLSFGQPYKEILYQAAKHHCDCNEARARRALVFVENQKTEPDEVFEVRCEFCGKQYNLKAEK